ncbi:membrane protein [Borreliella chilensis]|uniref:Membrane protein n=1 Tax=Borreliella chilensis TaxID=1245910 RepID=A0A0A7V358_9SPIR|nr:membrane protein [Borreliella chilensis]
MVRFLSFLCLTTTMLLINSCDMAQFGDYKPLYFKNEVDLKTANEYLNSLGYKTISEYTTKINILDFPENKSITIHEAKNLNNLDLRKNTFLKKLPNLFNIEHKKLLYVENKFKTINFKKLKKDLNINVEMHSLDYKTKINSVSSVTFLIITTLLIFLEPANSIFILIFLLISSFTFMISKEVIYFYPFTILSYLLFSIINNFNKNYSKIYLKDISFLTLIKKIKYLLYLFIFITIYFIAIITFFTTNIDPTFVAFVAIPTLCIFLIFSWIKTESNFKETFLFPIEIKEGKKEERKALKSKIAIHLMLFTLSLIPFIYSSYMLNSHTNTNYLYSKKLSYFDFLNPNNIYIMLGYNKNMPNIVGYLSHILYQNELKYNITAKYGKMPKDIKENYFEVKTDKIEINPKTVYRVNKSFIDETLKKDLASLFLKNKTPIIIYKENSNNINIDKANYKILFLFSLPFLVLLFLFKTIRFTILLNINEKTYKKYIQG